MADEKKSDGSDKAISELAQTKTPQTDPNKKDPNKQKHEEKEDFSLL